MKASHFSSFLKNFIPSVEEKTKQLNLASWILETTGSEDAAHLKSSLDVELKFLFQDPVIYQKLLSEKESDPILARELNVLTRAFEQNQIPGDLSREISQKEAKLAQIYANFRPQFQGKPISENEIREILKCENDPSIRKLAWESSKKIGEELALPIIDLVKLRNQAARAIGYSDYFDMQLKLQEIDRDWLLRLFDDLSQRSDAAYLKMMQEINEELGKRFAQSNLGPWAWSDPFCQEDPLNTEKLDHLVHGVDILSAVRSFYRQMGFDVQPIIDRSDMYERNGKNQHAFCINIDRKNDVRTLNNIQPSLKWLETVLHEFGHAVYELDFDSKLPWLLREPPHMFTTEAIALLLGRQAYQDHSLAALVGSKDPALLHEANESLARRQLIFSRWVLVMSTFESELYRDPSQDLNRLWWKLVEKYQKIPAPAGREGKADWAAKYHIGLAPVYYYSYLLGELFASMIQEELTQVNGSKAINTIQSGEFLRKNIFALGNRFAGIDLVNHAMGRPLSAEAWLKDYIRFQRLA